MINKTEGLVTASATMRPSNNSGSRTSQRAGGEDGCPKDDTRSHSALTVGLIVGLCLGVPLLTSMTYSVVLFHKYNGKDQRMKDMSRESARREARHMGVLELQSSEIPELAGRPGGLIELASGRVSGISGQ